MHLSFSAVDMRCHFLRSATLLFKFSFGFCKKVALLLFVSVNDLAFNPDSVNSHLGERALLLYDPHKCLYSFNVNHYVRFW